MNDPTPQNEKIKDGGMLLDDKNKIAYEAQDGLLQRVPGRYQELTPQNDELSNEIIIDPSALDFYFEAMLPEVLEQTRTSIARTMAKSISAEQKKLLDRILENKGEYISIDDSLTHEVVPARVITAEREKL